MPYYIPPQDDTERLAFLRTAIQSAVVDRVNGVEYVSQETLTEIDVFLPLFDEAFLEVTEIFGDHMQEVEESIEALGRLKLYLGDLWEVLRRRVHRHGEPSGVFRFYYLDADGREPELDELDEWLELAADLIAGDAQAVEAGFPAAVCPSVAEVQAVLDSAIKEAADVVVSDHSVSRAQAAIVAMRQQADEIIKDVMEELRFHLRKEEGASQRRIMRGYGVKFGYHPGEHPDLDDLFEEELEIVG